MGVQRIYRNVQLEFKITCSESEEEQIMTINNSVPLEEQIKAVLLYCANNECTLVELLENYIDLQDFEYKKFKELINKEKEYQKQDNKRFNNDGMV